jgi:hypothetical protein
VARKLGRGTLLIVIIVLAVIMVDFGVQLAGYNLITLGKNRNALSITNPAAQIVFNPYGTSFSFGAGLDNGAIFTNTCNGAILGYTPNTCLNSGGSSWSDTVVHTTIGEASTYHSFTYCDAFGVCTPTETLGIGMPGDLQNPGCYGGNGSCGGSGSYGTTFSLTGPQLETTSSPQCVNSPSDCIVYPSGNNTAPPPICPNGGCYAETVPFTVIKDTNATGYYEGMGSKTWYVYRFSFSIIAVIGFNGATQIAMVCVQVSNNDCPSTSLCIPGSVFGLGCTDPDGDIKAWAASSLNTVNAVDQLENSQISVAINTPLTFYQSNLDWFLYYGAWIGGQGPQGAGNCGSANYPACTLGVGAHASLGVYKDPQLTQGSFPTNTSASFPQYLQSLSLQQLEDLVPSVATNPVFISVPIQDFGNSFSLSSSCSAGNLPNCFSSTNGVTLTIPIIYDMIGLQTTAPGSYQWVNTQVSCYCQDVFGKIEDGASPFSIFGLYNGLASAQVSVGSQSATVGSGLSTFTDSSGNFYIAKVPITTGGAETVTLYVTDGSSYNVLQIAVALQVNSPPKDIGTFVLQPVSTGQVCLINPSANPVPGLPPIPGIGCIPTWEAFLIFVIVGGLLFFLVYLVVPSRRKATVTTKHGGISF